MIYNNSNEKLFGSIGCFNFQLLNIVVFTEGSEVLEWL